MTTARWAEMNRLFDELSVLPPETRRARLDALAKEQPELAAELEALLAADSETGHSMTHAVRAMATDLDGEASHRMLDTRLGAYRITRHIARGGMGDVFAAERDDGAFEQQVAIKLIGTRFSSAADEHRFAAERQILARLDHPGIARILDGGNADDGTAYLVMEYIEGEAIDDYCANNKLNLDQRLSLFRKVCDAVQYAHRNLIVHRDLKPSNILVTGDGQPKLLDFGIAKLMDDAAETGADVTELADRAMTPDFASPEQVLGDPITTSSDVYSLGVLLYLLTTGTRPYLTAGLRPGERERLLRDTEPRKPSTASQRLDDGKTAPALRLEPSRLRGDLDAVILTAMHKDPSERYASARAFADDIGAHLEGRPVNARGRTFSYVLRKFVRRHTLPVAAALVLLSSAVGATIYHTETVTAERDRAEAEVDRSAAVIAFLTEIFEVQNSENLGAQITAKQVLDAGAARLESGFDAHPSTQAALGTTIANVYANLGLYDESVAQHRAALAINEAYGEQAAAAENYLGLANANLELGEYDVAMEQYDRALALAAEAYPGDHVDRARFLNDFGYAHYVQGNLPDANTAYEAAIAMAERLGGAENAVWGAAKHNLGVLIQIQGDAASAEAMLRSSVDEALSRYGPASGETAIRTQSLANAVQELGRLEEAETLLLEVMEIEATVYGPDYPDLDVTMTNLGRLYRKLDRLDDAEQWLRKAVDHSVRTRGRDHAYTAYDMNNLARLLMVREDYEQAEPLYRDILAIYEVTVGPDHPYVISASVGLVALLLETDRGEEAFEYAQRAVDLGEQVLPPDHWLTYNAKCLLGTAMIATGDLDAADVTLHAAYDGLREHHPDHPLVRYAAGKLAMYYTARDLPDEAARFSAIHKGE